MDENPYQSPEAKAAPSRRGVWIRRILFLFLGIIAIVFLLAALAIPMGMIQRR